MDTKATPLRRSPKQARGERRIEVILNAAAGLFDEIGYEAATTVLIAQRAKTAVGSLYDFFPNKEAIAQKIVEGFTADLHALLDWRIGPEITQAPLEQILDNLIDPLVQFIHTRPGFRALYLKSQHIGQLSQAQQGLESFFIQRLAGLSIFRYPHISSKEAMRVARVCIETVKALTALAIEGRRVNKAVVADLKTMLLACLRVNFEGSSAT